MNPIELGDGVSRVQTSPALAPPDGPRLAFNNLIKRVLAVNDPNDPVQVARALMVRYRDDPRARAMLLEARGLPRLPVPDTVAPSAPQPGATGLDLAQALADVDADLRELISNNLSKDVVPELEGWARTIRSLAEQGIAAAQLAMDTRNRDKAFALRRQLGDFARLARLVGVLTPPLNADYRNLAQSIDEVAAVILVLMGETLANSGMAGGRYLLQVSFSELQARRDAVLNALRNLTGATQTAFDPNRWSRGIDAYRQLYHYLEARGLGDLRSLLEENELARGMDELIQLAGAGSSESLRSLGAAGWSQLARFHRFVLMTGGAVTPPSPPLVAFLETLQTFIDGFANAGGARLLRIARPAILFYGLYGSAPLTNAERRLLVLVNQRGAIAEQLDCLTRCACDDDNVRLQVLGDKVLYDIDRAIDLYCVGDDDLGMPEMRAAAYSYIVEAANQLAAGIVNPGAQFPAPFRSSAFTDIIDALRPPRQSQSMWDPNADVDFLNAVHARPPADNALALMQELSLQGQANEELRIIVQQMTNDCGLLAAVFGQLVALVTTAANAIATQDIVGASIPLGLPPVPDEIESQLATIASRMPNPSASVPNAPDHTTIVTELHMQIQSLTLRLDDLQQRMRGPGGSGKTAGRRRRAK